MSDNFELSQKRLLGLVSRLLQDPQVLWEYDKTIKEQISKGIVEIVEGSMVQNASKCHYLLHHAVIRKDKSTTKLRIIYDASANTEGPSLNDCLYAGLSFGQHILDILIRFRLHRIALIADIEKAFLIIAIAEQDRDVLRVLWLDDINSHLPRIQVLRFARVVFGVASSPFLLNATLKHHIEQLDPEFVKKFQRSIYVDDITFGAANVKETYALYEKSKTWLAEGGFNLRKPELQKMIDTEEYERETPSAVNNGNFEQNITSEDELYTKTTLGNKQNSPEILKVLTCSLQWRSTEDHLVFEIHHISELAVSLEPTKRNVVSLATRIYDPLGILSPFVVCFKMLCQQVCLHKVL